MPLVLDPPKIAPPPQDQRATFARRITISAIRLLSILAIAALLGGGWYLAKKGFGRQWRYRVVEELHKRGVEASIRRLTLDPFRGLVAQDVRIFDYKNRETTLARISEVSLDINYAAFIHRQPFLNAIDVRNAEMTLPIKRAKGQKEKPQLKNFYAHIYFPPEQIYVSEAEGNFCGMRISLTGQLIKREDYQPSPPLSEEERQKRMAILQRIVTELQKFSFPGGAPTLQVKFSGDIAEIENARVEATLRGERVRRDKYEIREFVAAAEWADRALTLTQCQWKDGMGTFAGRGSWNGRSNEAKFQARSSIELKSLLEVLGYAEALADTTFPASPVIEVSGEGKIGERPKIIGQATASSFTYRTLPFSDLAVNFSWDGQQTLLRDLHVRHQSGQLAAELYDAPGDFRLNIDSTINPGALRPLVSAGLQKFLGEWEWQRSPSVRLAIRGLDHNPNSWRGDGTIALDRTRFRGVWMDNATANVRFGDGAVTYDNLRVTRDEGIGTGTFTYDYKNHEVRFSHIKSSLRPAEVIMWIDPKLKKTVLPYKFRHTPNTTANGVYQFRGGKNTRLEIGVEAPGGMDYVFLGKTLPFDRISGTLIITNDRLQLADLKGGLFSGTTRGDADISLAKKDARYRANLALNGIDFPRLTELYSQGKTANGQLSGTYDFTGVGGDARTMRGSGKVQVSNGDVFAIPVFGPLSEILNQFLPGSGYSIARKATANFTVKDGVIHTDDFDVAGKLFGMVGHGDVHFLDDKLDFDLRISANGPGRVLTPMYKLFEYHGEGSLKKPSWHPKRF